MEHYLPLGPVEGRNIIDNYTFEEVKEKECVASIAEELSQFLLEKADVEGIKYLCICVPCYNEDLSELLKTLLSLLENFEFMERKVKSLISLFHSLPFLD